MVSIIIEGVQSVYPWDSSSLRGCRVCSHENHHHLGGTDHGSMRTIIIEGVKSVWGSDGVAISNYREVDGGESERAEIAGFMREQ